MPDKEQQTPHQKHYQKIRAEGLCGSCKTRTAVIGKSRCSRCADSHSLYGQARTARLRREIIDAYGGHCVCCKETTPEFLTIDHINGRGNKDTPLLKAEGVQLYAMLKRVGFPKEEFRLLCHNCNSALGMLGYCPHGNLGTKKVSI